MSRGGRRKLAALLAASVALATSTASAWEPVDGTKELAPRWSGPMIYRLNEEGSDDLDVDVLLAEVHRGLLEWTTPDCTGATARYDGLTAELPYTADEPGADNVIAWRETDWTHGPRAVAITAPSFISKGSGEPPVIVAASMWLNGEHWTWVTGASQDNQINLFSVILHEGGHYWGLGHTLVPMSVMNEDYSQDLTGLAADDIEGICSLYPVDQVAPPQGCEMDGGCGADRCVVDGDCARGDERCVAGRCTRLLNPPPAMCMRDSECDADETCAAGMCVAADPTQPLGLPVGSDCIMDGDCESGLCRLAGEATQCTDFCEADVDCGAGARCLRDGTPTGLCGPADLAPEPRSSQLAGSERNAEGAGCSAARSPGTASLVWLFLVPWVLRRARRS